MKRIKETNQICKKCGGGLDELDIQYGCARCRIIEERRIRKPSEYTEAEKRFFKNLKKVLEK